MLTLNELRQANAKTLHDARAILDLADKEERKLTEEENANYDKAYDEYLDGKEDVARREKLEAEEARLNAIVPTGILSGGSGDDSAEKRDEKVMADFRSFLLGETRGMEAQTDIKGGFLNAPEIWVNQLIKDLDNDLFFRQFATSHQIGGAEGIGAPALDTDYADWTWTSELNTNLSEDDAIRIGKREMKPYPLAKLVKISKKLMQTALMSPDMLARERLVYRYGGTLETAYFTGSGNNQPLGVFTAHANGISTGRDVSTGNSTTAVTVDGLKNAKWTLKGGYWAAARWFAHRDFMKMVDKLKDGEGRYLLQDDITGDSQARLLGFPVHLSEYAPNTFTTGLYVGILGDFSHYWILDSLAMQMQVLNELYALTNQIGIIGRYEGDGAPVNENAFVRVTLA